MGPAAHLGHGVLRAQTVGHDVGHVPRGVRQRRIAGHRREMGEGQAHPGQTRGQVEAEVLPLPVELADADVQHLQRLGPSIEAVEDIGDAVQPVVEPEANAGLRVRGAADEPFLVLGMAAGAGSSERIQHTRGAIGDVDTLGPELLRVAGKEPVVAFGGGAGEDGAGHGVPRPRPRIGFRVHGPGGARGRLRSRGLWPPGELVHGRGEELRRHREGIGDHGRELLGFARREREKCRQGQEQEQPHAGQGVPVDVEPSPISGRQETRVAQGRPSLLADVRCDLEVDQHDRAVGPDENVVRVEIAEHDTALMDSVDGVLDAGDDVDGPRGVLGERGLVGIPVHERVPLHEQRVQGSALDEVLDQEVMSADREVVAEPGNDVESGQALEDVALAAEPGYGIGTVHRQARMGAGLFEHDPFACARVDAGVQPAPVGEVESLVDPVGHLLDRRTVAGRQVRHQTTG